MAYLRDLAERCTSCKVREAKVELHNRLNTPIGKFCRSCGNARLASLNRMEARSDAEIERERKERRA